MCVLNAYFGVLAIGCLLKVRSSNLLLYHIICIHHWWAKKYPAPFWLGWATVYILTFAIGCQLKAMRTISQSIVGQ